MAGGDLNDIRLVVVLGKGGVGKSTVAAALGLKAAARGRRTIVAEIGGRGDVGRMFGDRADFAGERELVPGLWTIGIEPARALEEYLSDQLPIRAVADLLGASRTFGYLTAATPGLRELLCIGKVWELAQPRRRAAGARPYDLVILDAPATGHGVALLAAPRTFARAAQVGPIARQGARIGATLRDRSTTAAIAVCTPQEAAVSEALQTRARLADELGIELAGVVVNGLRPRRFKRQDIRALREAAVAATPDDRPALELALAEDARVRAERAQLRRVRQAVGEPAPVELPFVYAEEIGSSELERLGRALWP
jgi:anion-transporting  ArsA/GET3 family ATPase